ncbi:hypothetical protein [Dactylosporangium sp. NPDC051541]|uniref:hypothetical protein n=1 Tax=Dactylosporangium sp. NPDC051541 TaxID=3363977 RepID=UPI00378EF5AF
MTIDDADLRRLRALAGPRTETTADDLARLRHRVVTGTEPTPDTRPSWTRRRWAAPVAAAAVALAVVAGVAVALNPGPAGNRPAVVASGTATLGRPVRVADAFAELERAAARTGAATAGPTDLLHIHRESTRPVSPVPPSVYVPSDSWYEVQGMIEVWPGSTGVSSSSSGGPGRIAVERAEFAAHGPSVYQPSPEWLAGLPSDPDELALELRLNEDSKLDPVTARWGRLTHLLAWTDPLLPPGVRVALLRLLARTGAEVVAQEVTVGGRRMLGLRSADSAFPVLTLFDPATAHVVGDIYLAPPAADVPLPPLSGSPGPGAAPPSPPVSISASDPAYVIDLQVLYSYEIVPA